MNITPVSFFGINNTRNNSLKNIQFKSLKADSISFSSNYTKSSQRIDEAVSLGYEIYFNSIKKQGFDPQKFLAKKEKDVQILSMDLLKKGKPDADNYCAYFSCEYDDDINPYDMKLYIGQRPKTTSSMPNILHAMEVAHEYTHFLQTKEKYDSDFIRELSNADKEYTLLLNGLGGAVFSIFDNAIQAKFVSNSFDKNDIAAFLKYKQIAPVAKNVNKEDLLYKNGFENQEKFEKELNTLFDLIYDKVFEEINTNSPNVEPRVKNAFMTYLAKEGSIGQLKKDVRKYCGFIAQTEFEAYSTESKLAKKVLQIPSGLNIDAFTIYYDLLSGAFKH